MFRIEHNVETGEIIEIPLTAQEIKEIEKLQKEAAEQQAIIDAELAEKKAARQAIADRLGLTADELKLLLG
jgi:hypothetical protein